uniref:Uncharacterized protein n=1 Tax=Solanum tuberosum TaxID=4113 RepID=M1DRH3_SOLTU
MKVRRRGTRLRAGARVVSWVSSRPAGSGMKRVFAGEEDECGSSGYYVRMVTDRGSCPWIDAPKAQLQSRLTVDQHGPSFDARYGWKAFGNDIYNTAKVCAISSLYERLIGLKPDFGQFRKVRVHARDWRKEEKREERSRFVDFVKDSLWNSSGVIPTRCNFGLNLSYIEGINDPKFLGKEPLKFRGFRVEKRRRKVVKHLGKGVGRRAS